MPCYEMWKLGGPRMSVHNLDGIHSCHFYIGVKFHLFTFIKDTVCLVAVLCLVILLRLNELIGAVKILVCVTCIHCTEAI